MPYDPTIYSGSAAHYRAGRPPYSAELDATLTDAVGLDGRGRLLDVGCGPGTLAIGLAGRFEEAIGLDPDTDMLAEARRWGAIEGIANLRWVRALAEELPEAAPGPYRLITFGQSFQWTHEDQVAEVVYDLLEPDGAFALVVHTVEGRPRPPNPGYSPIPHEELAALVERYLGSRKRAGQGCAPVRTHRFEDVLRRSRFGEPTRLFAAGRPYVVRDSEGVLAGYFSMSWSAPHLFGDRLADFANQARALLKERSPIGLFWDWPGDTEIVLARKRRNSPR